MANDILISFFMFTTNLYPGDADYTKLTVDRMRQMRDLGYTGFDLPIVPSPTPGSDAELEGYQQLRKAMVAAGLGDVKITTNVFATHTFDPSQPYAEQRKGALEYLKSRVNITNILGGEMMAGPLVVPYGGYPTTDLGDPIWSDALQDVLAVRYNNAKPIFNELAGYAQEKGVKIAIEPVCHWETPGPNLVGEVLDFAEDLPTQIGLCLDTAQVVLGSDGVGKTLSDISRAQEQGRLHYVHISAPDRGTIKDCWIPWEIFMPPIQKDFSGPYLVEIFNAIPPFLNGLRLTRRKFWFGDDTPTAVPDAFQAARESLEALRKHI